MLANLFEAGKTWPGVDMGALHPEPYLGREINSQFIKIRAQRNARARTALATQLIKASGD